MLGDFAQGMDETHVQHMVGFVQNQIAALFKADVALFQMVDQTTGRRHQNVGPARQGLGLLHHRSPAHHHGDFDGGAFGKDFKIVLDLDNQLARRRKDQGADVFWSRRVAKVKDAVQEGQAESSGLAGAGLRQTHQVVALHDMGNGLRLNGRRRLDGGLFQCFEDLRRKAKVGESGHV